MIRRVILTSMLFLLAASCYSPVLVEKGFGGQSMPCREVSRSRCDTDQCGGSSMDYVTYQCGTSQPTSRCVANFRCRTK